MAATQSLVPRLAGCGSGIVGDFAGQPNLNLITATATQRGDDWTAAFNVGALVDVALASRPGSPTGADRHSRSHKRPEQLRIDDGHEFHVGAEYLFPNAAIPLALRSGFWHDPDHVVRDEPTAANDDIDKLFVATLPGGSSQAHCTFGAGLAPTRWLELNGAADLASRPSTSRFRS
jgi:hypothetical protein